MFINHNLKPRRRDLKQPASVRFSPFWGCPLLWVYKVLGKGAEGKMLKSSPKFCFCLVHFVPWKKYWSSPVIICPLIISTGLCLQFTVLCNPSTVIWQRARLQLKSLILDNSLAMASYPSSVFSFPREFL